MTVPPTHRIIIPEVVVIHPRRRVVALLREAHVEHERLAVAVRVLVRGAVAEGFAGEVPAPDGAVCCRIEDDARGAEGVGFDVVQLLRRAAADQQADGQVVQPDDLLEGLAGGGVVVADPAAV